VRRPLQRLPMAIYRLVCALGRQGRVPVLTRCGLPLPPNFLADEKQSHCRAEKIYVPTVVSGRLIWHVGYSTDKSARPLHARMAPIAKPPGSVTRPMTSGGFCRTALTARAIV
jgi:hypothetical protein